MTQYVKPALLILVPFLIGLGRIVKICITTDTPSNAVARIIKKMLKTTSRIPYLLWFAGVITSTVYGFVVGTGTGWKLVVDALFMTGLIQGSVVAWTAMGLYDTAKHKD